MKAVPQINCLRPTAGRIGPGCGTVVIQDAQCDGSRILFVRCCRDSTRDGTWRSSAAERGSRSIILQAALSPSIIQTVGRIIIWRPPREQDGPGLRRAVGGRAM